MTTLTLILTLQDPQPYPGEIAGEKSPGEFTWGKLPGKFTREEITGGVHLYQFLIYLSAIKLIFYV